MFELRYCSNRLEVSRAFERAAFSRFRENRQADFGVFSSTL